MFTRRINAMKITFKHNGNFDKLDEYFKKSIRISKFKNISDIADECIKELAKATPKKTGKTSRSWEYEITREIGRTRLIISNSNVVDGVNIAFLIDIGHATSSGKWIEGEEYIEPVVRNIYNNILNNAWKELKRL